MSNDAPSPAIRKRSWPRIGALLFLIALVCGAVAWFARPKTVTATALFEVRMDTPSLVGNQAAQRNQDYEILRKTQVALLKSKFVLTSALRNPSIGALSVLAGVGDKEAWLQDHLEVGYPHDGEILEIKLRGTAWQADDLILLVDAVGEAYKKEVLGNEIALRMNRHDLIERSLQNLQVEIKRKYEDYLDIAKGMGRAEGSNDIEQQLNMKRLDRIDEELAQLEREQLKMENGDDAKYSKFVKQRIEQLTKRQNELQKTMEKRSEMSIELTTRKNELDQLQAIAKDLSINLEKMDIESQLPSRIRQVQPATVERGDIAAGFMHYLGNP
jgi:hypothetical protein